MLTKLRKSFRRKSSKKSHSQNGVASGLDRMQFGCHSSASSMSSLGSCGSLQSARSHNSRLTDVSSMGTLRSDVSSTGTLRGAMAAGHGLHDLNSDSQWQKKTPSVVESNRVMLERQLQCDVTFVVGEEAALVSGHKYVLMSRSEVFRTMFLGPLSETGPIVIPEVTEAVFRQFLLFLYVEEVALTSETVTSLHYLGRKYDVEPLVQRCLEFLHGQLTAENACSIVEQAHRFEERELYSAAWDFLTLHLPAVLAAGPSTLSDLCRECLGRLLSLEMLEVGELPLWLAAHAWTQDALLRRGMTLDAYNVRQELGPLLESIRFPAMTLTELKDHVFSKGILTLQEVKGLVAYKEKGRCGGATLPFIMHGRMRLLHRFKGVTQVTTSSVKDEEPGWTAAVTFSCDRDFNLHGFHIYACTSDSPQAEVGFSLLQGQAELQAYNQAVSGTAGPSRYPHTYLAAGALDGVKTLTLSLGQPLLLQAGKDYTLVVTATRLPCCFLGTGGVPALALDDITFRFRHADVTGNSSTVNEGQIPCLMVSLR